MDKVKHVVAAVFEGNLGASCPVRLLIFCWFGSGAVPPADNLGVSWVVVYDFEPAALEHCSTRINTPISLLELFTCDWVEVFETFLVSCLVDKRLERKLDIH